MSEEQIAQETPRAAAAFAEYCALGPARSLRRLAEKREQSGDKASTRLATLAEWSTRYNWQERVKQYDSALILDRVVKKQAKRDEMDERHAKEAKEEQQWARAVLETGKEREYVSLAAVHLLKNSREDERKALIEEEKPVFEPGGQIIGIAIYLPQKRTLKEADPDGSSES